MTAVDKISLQGVAVHNLKSIDLDLPHRQLIVFCGLSGSGKSSLALDTLYAEGQRRYIESFSAYTRQFLQRLEKPEAERIDGIPPAIAVASKTPAAPAARRSAPPPRPATICGCLFAKIGHVFCLKCGREVRLRHASKHRPGIDRLAARDTIHGRIRQLIRPRRTNTMPLAAGTARRRICSS